MTAAQLFVGLALVAAYLLLNWLILRGGTGVPVSSRGRHRPVVAPVAVADAFVRVERSIPMAEWVRPEDAELVEERRRRQLHEGWMRRRAVEAPWFAQLAQQMGLGLALGVAA